MPDAFTEADFFALRAKMVAKRDARRAKERAMRRWQSDRAADARPAIHLPGR